MKRRQIPNNVSMAPPGPLPDLVAVTWPWQASLVEFTVTVGFWTATSLSEGDLFAVAQLGGAAAGTPGTPGVSTTLTVTAANALEAAAAGSRRVASKLARFAVPISVEAVASREFDAQHGFESLEG